MNKIASWVHHKVCRALGIVDSDGHRFIRSKAGNDFHHAEFLGFPSTSSVNTVNNIWICKECGLARLPRFERYFRIRAHPSLKNANPSLDELRVLVLVPAPGPVRCDIELVRNVLED